MFAKKLHVKPIEVDADFEFSEKFERLSNKEKRRYFEEKSIWIKRKIMKETGLTLEEATNRLAEMNKKRKKPT
jgi:hypothetical protein